MTAKKRILIVSSDESIRVFIAGVLQPQGYETITVEDGATGMQHALRIAPDAIILDMLMPRLDGYHVYQMLHADTEHSIPVIMLAHHGSAIARCTSGAHTVLTTPFDPMALVLRVETIVQRQLPDCDQNPFVQLSGHINIGHELSQYRHFAVGYADLDDLMKFNIQHGSTKGDLVISHTHHILQHVLQQIGTPNDRAIHIKADDFVFITVPEKIEPVCQAIISRFDREILRFYDTSDPQEDELLSISIAVVTNVNRQFTDFAEIGEIAMELQKYVKSLPGSNYRVNRRSR